MPTTGRVLRLAARETLAIPRGGAAAVEVLGGSVWLTETGAAGDHFARSGEHIRLAGTGLAVVEALAAAEIRLCRPAARNAARGAIAAALQAWHRLGRPAATATPRSACRAT